METEIVISGMSGRFPEADNIAELSEKLFNKVDLVTEDERRWQSNAYGLPKRSGKLKDFNKFDNLFFGVHHKQSHDLDPQARMLLEITYESIVDAGYDPAELRGRKIGVFIGNILTESGAFMFENIDPEKFTGYAIIGCSQAMLANRISYVFDFRGPSFTLDTACSSGAMALYQAFQAIRRGDCEAAIVGGTNLSLKPEYSFAFHKLKMLSNDGKCKSFDASCDGYVRSDAVAALFIQKFEDARRNYATILNVKTNTDGFKPQGITFPSTDMQKQLMSDVLEECTLDPRKISYVEAHATGTQAGDPAEMSAIAEVFCRDRKEPLLVGSVKSNIGHTESAAGIRGIIKILLAIERGILPPNLHFNEPNPKIQALIEGRVKVVTEPTLWKENYAAFNNFGICGIIKILLAIERGILPPNLHFNEPNPNIQALIEGRVKVVTKPTPWEGKYVPFNNFGICGIIKILLAIERGILPPNLHFNEPNPNIQALIEGRVKVVTEPTPWEGNYTAFNNFGICGIIKILLAIERGILPPNLHFNEPNPNIQAMIEGRVKVVTKPTPWEGKYVAFNNFGICGIIKILLAIERGILPPNLHFNEPNPNIQALIEGRVKVVTEPTPWEGNYAAFNNFGFGGANVHGILKFNSVVRQAENNKSLIPQLLLYSGRTEESVKFVFDNTSVKEATREFFPLVHKFAHAPANLKPYRGYMLLDGNDGALEVKRVPLEKLPLWYVFSGMGTQWPGMAKDLMQIEIFAKSIRKSAEILKPFALNLVDILTNEKQNDNLENSKASERSIIPAFVSISAIQIALVDVLNELGLKPDGFVGHSLGELGCAYADGCLTAEQTLLASYWRGKATEDSDLIQGAMAAVGMSWAEAQKLCPKDIYPACHNGEDSVTIAGPKQSIRDFIEKLNAENVFAREVNTCGYAYHCDYILPVAEKLQASMEKVIPNPKPRSSRWISSSYTEDKWNDPECKFSSASYFVHNLVGPVQFCDAVRHIPKKVIVVEIGPHHLLQSILKREIGSDAVLIGLMKKNVDNIVYLLCSIGKLYVNGVDPDIEKLYPPVSFPVPRNTPMISPLIKWDHSENWTNFSWSKDLLNTVKFFEINAGPQNSPDHYLLGHIIDGRCIFPATGYIYLVWNAFASMKFQSFDVVPIKFENVKFKRATFISKTVKTKLAVSISKESGFFEISESGMIVCTGTVSSPSENDVKFIEPDVRVDKETLILNTKDVYKELRLRRYGYLPSFQGIMASSLDGGQGIVKWEANWLVFLDSVLQLSLLKCKERRLGIPTKLQNLTIDPEKHKTEIEKSLKEYPGIPTIYDSITKEYFSAGVYIKRTRMDMMQKRRNVQTPVLEEYRFIPYVESCSVPKSELQLYTEYVNVCSALAKKILELSGRRKDQVCDSISKININDALIDKYMKSEESNYVLLKFLSAILNTPHDVDLLHDIRKYVNDYLHEHEKDVLTQILLKESNLRTLTDIAFENSALRQHKVVEISEGSNILSSKINEYNHVPSELKLSFSILHNRMELINKNDLPPNTEITSWENNSSLPFQDVYLLVLNCLKFDSIKAIRNTLENAKSCLKNEGFILFLAKTTLIPAEVILSTVSGITIPSINESNLEQLFKELNLNIICKRFDSFTYTLYLLRRRSTSSYMESVIHIFPDKCDQWVKELKEKILQLPKLQDSSYANRVWLVSEGSHCSGIVGLVNCLRQEPGGSNIRCVFTGERTAEIPQFSLSDLFYKEQLEKDLVMNIFQNKSWGSYRHIQCKKDISTIQTEHAYLNIQTIGDLSTFTWIDCTLKTVANTENGVLCHVYYSALNFRDIMLASGKLTLAAIPGSLIDKDCVLGTEFSGRTFDGRRVMGIVENKSMATTLVAHPFLLWDVPENWTLEEAATIPMAYLTAYYALVTRGRLKKRESVLIHSGSGGVGQAAITVALSMGCEVFTSVGVHVVLNSLAEEKLRASLNCLAPHGRFLEIGKYDFANDSSLGMAMFLKNISFHGVLVDVFFHPNNVDMESKSEAKNLLVRGIADGIVKPLDTTVFDRNEAEQAFRYMSKGRHMGKILLKIRDEEQEKNTIPPAIRVPAILRTTFDPHKTYVIIGGLGGFGLEMCQWLVGRGAKNLVLNSRSGVTTGYQKLCLERWKCNCINIVLTKLNAVKENEARDLLLLADRQGPVGGIFNLAVVLKDGLMENQTLQNYIDVCEPKIEITKNLDLLSKELCPELEWFVCFSSLACGKGHAGQSNYGYANSVMERICENRVREGLPGLAIQWGAVRDVGFTQETMGPDVVMCGTIPQGIESCFSVLDQFLQQSHPVVSSFVPCQLDTTTKILAKSDLLSSLANIFGIKDVASINLEASLGELGMDSLMGVELRQILEINFDILLSISELRSMKVRDLKQLADQGKRKVSDDAIQAESVIEESFAKQFMVSNSKSLIPTEAIVSMTAIKTGTPLFVIHPLEGSVFTLQSLVQSLPCPVYGVQSTVEAPGDSIERFAAWCWKQVKSINIAMKAINLAGYSFGGTVALQMALQAEQDSKEYPEIKNLVLLEGPTVVRTFAIRDKEFSQNVTDQISSLIAFAMMFHQDPLLDTKAMQNLNSLQERISYTAEKIAAVFPDIHSEDVEKLFHQLKSKADMILSYSPKHKLKKDIILFKASERYSVFKTLTDLYDLDKVCEGKITFHTIEGTHRTFIQGDSAKHISNLLKSILSL